MYLMSTWFVVTLIAAFIAAGLIKNEGVKDRRSICFALTTVALISMPLWYEFAGPYTIPVAVLADNRFEPKPNGMLCWEFGQGYSAIPRDPTQVYGEVRVITDNPKVRQIHYKLQTRIMDLDAWFSQPHRKGFKNAGDPGGWIGTGWYALDRESETAKDEIGKTVVSLLFEFNDTHSRDLARFYNPLDLQQNEDLKELLEPWLNERLAADGLEVSYKSFSIE